MKHHSWLGIVRAAALALGVFAILAGVQSCASRGDPDVDEGEGQAASPSQAAVTLAVVNGQTVLTLTPAAESRMGIGVVTLAASVTRAERAAPALVLPAQDLVSFRNSYIAAQAQAQMTQASSAVARKEYVRLKTLYAENQEVSQKALESAEGTWQSDRAQERAAEEQLGLQADVVRQRWGPVVTQWALGNSSELASVLAQREWFVQVTLPPGTIPGAEPPESVSLELPTGNRVAARFVSTLPQVDPRIQGLTYLYRSPAAPGVSAGAALVAHFPVGKPMRGVVVPEGAVVWSAGQAWAYKALAPNRFQRFLVSTEEPVAGGWFVTSGFVSGDRVVTTGAAELFSAETLPSSGGGEAGGDDD